MTPLLAMTAGMLVGLILMATPCPAQISSSQTPTQNSGGGPAPPSISSGVPGLPGAGTTPAVGAAPGLTAAGVSAQTAETPTTISGIGPSSGPTLTVRGAPVGRGLPGMPGGPPLSSRMGAQDPSGRYMSPPTIGPLVCMDLTSACQ